MIFCEMYKPSGCKECPNRWVCKDAENYIEVPIFSETANEYGSYDIIEYRREYID